MAKKRAREADGSTAAQDPTADKMDEDDEDEEDFDMVDVNFEWFNFDSEIDFHGIKTLLRQLFDVDAPLFDISGLADLIIAQNTIGSAVKVDEKANDAYAFLTVLNAREHRKHAAVKGVVEYLCAKARGNQGLAEAGVPALLEKCVTQEGDGAPVVGVVFAERLINMPAEIVPPMYEMLLDEVEAALEDGEPYKFTHYLVVSKTYREIRSDLGDGEGEGSERRKKKNKAGDETAVFHFHPEDEVLQKHAVAHGDFAYSKANEAVADSKRAFQEMGVQAQGSMILIEAGKFPGAVKKVNEFMGRSS